MAIYIKPKAPQTPQGLLDAIYKAIDDGHIETWKYTEKNKNFVHDTKDQQWLGKAFFHPTVETQRIVLGLWCYYADDKGVKLIPIERKVYGILHGRFIEPMLNHLNNEIEIIWPSVNPDTTYDKLVFEA